MTVVGLFWLIPALPLASFALLAGGLSRYRRVAVGLALGSVLAATLLSIAGVIAVAQGARATVWLPWLNVGGRVLTLALSLDPLGILVAALVSILGLVVFAYAASYMARERYYGRFFALSALFAGAMLTLVLAADLVTFFVAWEIVGICSYLLIGFRFEQPAVPGAATKALLITRLADLALLGGILTLIVTLQTGRLDALVAALASDGPAPRISSTVRLVVALLLLAGAAGKSAQVPLHGWLPDAMVGPTPVSALLHSATMVAAGVFLIARLSPIFVAAPPSLLIIGWIGATTALVGAVAALLQTDLKRLLAYSTISQLGLMFIGLGVGSVSAALFLLIAHAFYKALLFLAAGSVEQAVGGTALAYVGGLARRLPLTFVAFSLAAAALAGLPITVALPPKDAVLAAAWPAFPALFGVSLLASFLTALYSARALGLVFLGPPSGAARRARPERWALVAPTWALALLLEASLLASSPLIHLPIQRLLGTPIPEAPVATTLGIGLALLGFTLGLGARLAWPRAIIWPTLQPIAPSLSRALAMGWLYAAIAWLALRLAGATGEFDRSVLDSLASTLATWTLALVRLVVQFDTSRIEAGARAIAAGLVRLGDRTRSLQTGRIENYLLAIFGWALVVIIVAAVAAGRG